MASQQDIEKLIGEHSDSAYSAAFRLTGNQADAGDLVQDAFLRVLAKAGLYDPSRDFGAWLYRIIFRVYLNRKRGEERRREIPLEYAGGPEGAGLPAAGEEPGGAAELKELREGVLSALDALPRDLRACLVLVDMEGRSYEEAAGILDWPVGSVAGRLFRARRLLRGSLS